MIHYPDKKLLKKSVPCLLPQNVTYTCFTLQIPFTTMIYEEIKENHSENAYTVQIFKPVTQLNDALCEHLEKDKSLMQCSTLDHKA